MKASFGSRLAAYILDFLIISAIISIICYAIPNKNEETENKVDDLANELVAGNINSEEYINEYKDLLYEDQKTDIVKNIVNVVLTIGYFVVFQYMNKGQTLGKKILSIRVVDNDTEKPTTIVKGLLRSIMILSIISGLSAITLINFMNKNMYMNTYLTIGEIEVLLLVVSIIFVLYRKDGRGLHDMVANTKVIKEER